MAQQWSPTCCGSNQVTAPGPPHNFVAGKFVLDPELYDPLIRLVSLIARPRDIPVLAPLIRREIIWNVETPIPNTTAFGWHRLHSLTDISVIRPHAAVSHA
jgi:hypothetical protein